jgi:hypothetical protein
MAHTNKVVKLTVWVEVPDDLEPRTIVEEIKSNLSDALDCRELIVNYVESYPPGHVAGEI